MGLFDSNGNDRTKGGPKVKTGHQKTLDALKAYVANGNAPQLKAFAEEMIPIVTAHLNMAKAMKA